MTHVSQLFDDWIARRHPVARETVAVPGGRVYILPTRSGWLYALLVAVMLLGANHYANNMAFMLAFLLAGLGLNAMWHAVANLKGLVVHRGGAAPVFAGQTLHFIHEIENPTRRARHGLHLIATDGTPVRFSLDATERMTIDLPIPTNRRGPHREGRLVLATRHPLGLFHAWTYAEFDATALVWPRPAERVPPIPVGGDDRKDDDTASAETEADHGDLSGLQPYRSGDPPRRVAWKAVARTGQLVSKAFTQPPGGDEAWADWFTLGTLGTEERLSTLCRWLLDCHRRGRPCGLKMPGALIPPETGDAHLRRCLDRLAHYGRG